ncbi:MAG: efflux RND transporter periplasmic adaptor subunit [Pseudomonadota bacterium]
MFRPLSLALLLALSWPVQAGDKLISLTPAQRAALKIGVAPLAANAGAVSVGLPARVVIPPAQERLMTAPVAGAVAELRVAAGDPVRAGQTLVVLRGESLVSAQRDLAQAAVQADLARDGLARDQALFEEGIIPESRLRATRAALAQADAVLRERRAWLRLMGVPESAIKAAEKGDAFTDSLTLVAPVAGVVLAVQTSVGARVESAAPLLHLARLDPLWLEIQAPAHVAALVKHGQRVSVPGLPVAGSVLSVGQGVGEAQTVPIRASIGNPGGLLRLNQSVSARIEDVAGARHWRVPISAIVRQAGQNWVFVERPGGFEAERVKVLSQAARLAAIDGPFGGEERVVVEGVAALKSAWLGE